MSVNKRCPTIYPGVYYRLTQRLNGKGEEKTYYCTYKVDGKKVEVRLGRAIRDDLTPARAALMRADLIEGRRKPPQEIRREQAARITIQKLWAEYAASLEGKKILPSDKSSFKRIESAVANKTVDELTTGDVDALRDKLLADGFAAQTVKHSLGLLRRMIRFGAKKGLCDVPPRLFFTMPTVDNVKTEFLTPEQIKRLFEALDADRDQIQANAVRLVLSTGLRKSALLALQWDDIDFERDFITLRGACAKNGKTARIPMSAAARTILENMPRFDSPYVFPSPKTGGRRVELRHILRRIKVAAGLPEDFRPLHGLRHTYASYLASSGEVDLYTLQRLLTHNSPQMTQRYAHLADEALRRAADVSVGLFDQQK